MLWTFNQSSVSGSSAVGATSKTGLLETCILDGSKRINHDCLLAYDEAVAAHTSV